jgi:hypothetical protein
VFLRPIDVFSSSKWLVFAAALAVADEVQSKRLLLAPEEPQGVLSGHVLREEDPHVGAAFQGVAGQVQRAQRSDP